MELNPKDVSILVVDDNEMNVELLVSILDRYDYNVYTANHGKQALEIVQQHKPELVLLDINMPEMDGYEVCRRIKANPDTSEIPVIFISALADTENVIEGFDAGGVDYIMKPFKYREVIVRIETQVMLFLQKREIEQLRQREQQSYQRMDQIRRQFIGSATHDLKNPLFVISGYADMLEMSPTVADNPHLLGFVQSIKRGVGKMSDLVYDMLDLLQLEMGIKLDKQATAFVPFLQEVTQDMRVRAQEKSITLTVHPPTERVTLEIDAQRIGRVLDNLISNAIKYTPAGGTVDVYGKCEGNQVIVEVIDSGLGIPADILPTIFQPFERVNTEEHMAQEGTGLGLSIVKTIVEQHDGIVTVESTLGEGSCFRFILPLE
ncbi:MAG: sensor histidine kinase [Anaerolineae bacterium]